MAVTVAEASARYENFMVNPAPVSESGVCPRCRGFMRPGYDLCYGCDHAPDELDAIVPITYSVHLEQMHTELRGYKNPEYTQAARDRSRVGLTAVLWRFLNAHEPCIATLADADAFEVVTTVPSSVRERDDRPGGLRSIVAEMCGHTRDRYVRALLPTDRGSSSRRFDSDRYEVVESVTGVDVLLVDDTWASGSHAQSAAYTLRHAGARTVACVVIGRHCRREFETTSEVLKAQPPFSWNICAAE